MLRHRQAHVEASSGVTKCVSVTIDELGSLKNGETGKNEREERGS
jgi:hypothetical protein